MSARDDSRAVASGCLRAWSGGDNVCIIYDLVTKTPPARIPTAGWYRVQDGKVTSVRAFFDPRPLMPAGSGPS